MIHRRSKTALGRFSASRIAIFRRCSSRTILLVGQVSFGVLESFSRTALAIATAMLFEFSLGRLVFGKISESRQRLHHGHQRWHPDSFAGILALRALRGAIAITSKYVSAMEGRHLWNPSNFAHFALLLLLAPEYMATLSIQWGNTFWPMMVVWVLGAMIVYRVKRFHITATYVVSFLALAALRSAITGHPFLAEVAPITGPMYQLFIFFMITDPKTTVKPKWAQMSGGVPGGRSGNGSPPGAERRRAILRSRHSGPGGHGNRDLANAETCSPECRHCRRLNDGVLLTCRFPRRISES